MNFTGNEQSQQIQFGQYQVNTLDEAHAVRDEQVVNLLQSVRQIKATIRSHEIK